MRTLPLLLLLACAPVASEPPDDTMAPDTEATPAASWRSELFPEDWDPSHTLADGRFLHDVSYAGYGGGGVDLPTPPTTRVDVRDHGADPTGATDSTAAIQAAIDAAPGATVWLPAGTYRVDGTLSVTTAGTWVVGDGPDATFVHFTRDTGTTGSAGLTFRGQATADAAEWVLTADGASRAFEVQLDDVTHLAVGDEVALGFTITPAFVDAHGMTGTWTVSLDQWRPFFRRTVAAIDGTTVRLDVPLRYPALLRDGASLRRNDRQLVGVGLADLAVSSVVSDEAAWAADRHHAVQLVRVMDAVVQRVVSYAPSGSGPHLQSGGLLVADSRRVTVADCELGPVQNNGGGGNGYLYELGRSNEILVRDSVGRGGRHNFIQNWDFGASGLVFLRTTSTEGRADNGLVTITGDSEFHHSLAMANLIDDSVVHDGWTAKNRRNQSSGAGHAATETVFWNLRGTGTVWSMQYGHGYVVGTGPELTVVIDPATPDLLQGSAGTLPADHAEGVGVADTLEPRSLYEAQLTRRLGR